VAIFADVGRADVIEVLTGGGHAIMAVAATLGSNILVIEVRRNPAGGTMTVIIALCRGRQVIQVLTHRGNAVMTTAAGTQHLEVIDRNYWIPQVGAVAVFADVSGCNVVE